MKTRLVVENGSTENFEPALKSGILGNVEGEFEINGDDLLPDVAPPVGTGVYKPHEVATTAKAFFQAKLSNGDVLTKELRIVPSPAKSEALHKAQLEYQFRTF